MSDGKKTYTEEEVKESTIKYFSGDELASDVWVSKYALRNADGEFLEKEPSQMHRRLAKEFARIEKKYPNSLSEDEIYSLFEEFKYVIPQGSPMSGIGNEYQLQSLANCFVIPSPGDSIGSIARTDEEESQIMKRRGGVGLDISNIRPRGMTTANAARTTDGISAFMEKFSNTCRGIAQGGRRGALMLSIIDSHPELETFINIKKDLTKVTGANISVKVTDEFMNAVESDSDFILRYPVTSTPETALYTKTVKAKNVWDQMMVAAHTSAEPGILFWDTILRESPSDCYTSKGFGTVSTNPCSEIPLSANYDSCRLIVVNALSYVRNSFKKSSNFDFDLFANHVKKAQRLMDDLVDLEIECIERIIKKIESDPETDSIKSVEMNLWKSVIKAGQQGRRTGLGLTGIGDTVAALCMQYGSTESIEFVEKLYAALAVATETSSTELAEERGVFQVYDYELEKANPYLLRVAALDKNFAARWKKFGRRNISTTTTAPCGSISLCAKTTSGIEPAFLLQYKRRKKINTQDANSKVDFVDQLGDKWQEYEVYHHGVKAWMEATGKTDITQSPYWNSTADKIDWEKSVDLQAAAQKYISHAISKTCNLPNTVTVETVSNIYMKAWKTGCKGFTIYRDGSRSGVLVSSEKKYEDVEAQPAKVIETHAPKRPLQLPCDIHRVKVKGESYLAFVGLLNDKPYELFCGLSEHVEVPKKIKRGFLVKNSKSAGLSTYNLKIPLGDDDEVTFKDVVTMFENQTNGAFTRTLSLALRHGTPIQYICEQLGKDKHSDMQSFSTVIARVLKTYIKDGTEVASEKSCPTCSNTGLIYQEGCITCPACGYSKCG
jgi:ribonucleoside-diphosphate reductase alpha chain